jgi:hypothetical protein
MKSLVEYQEIAKSAGIHFLKECKMGVDKL